MLRNLPVPPQRGHGRLKRMAPAICVTLPLPLHSAQTVLAPGREPVPPHVAQLSCRAMFRRTCVPRMACQKSMLSPYSRSVPGCGTGCGVSFARPNHWLKMSWKFPAPPAPPASPALSPPVYISVTSIPPNPFLTHPHHPPPDTPFSTLKL